MFALDISLVAVNLCTIGSWQHLGKLLPFATARQFTTSGNDDRPLWSTNCGDRAGAWFNVGNP